MRFVRARVLVLLLILVAGLFHGPANADSLKLKVAEDKISGYNRSAFKHWIDADKDGCDTRAEVLIEEAIIKPIVGPKCKITGGKWISAYDGKAITNASQLDVDHLVPLAEAWRSGAWKWTAAQRKTYANDLENPEALIAVTLSTNRSKGDKDPALWMPTKEQCTYTENWIAIKFKYSLTVDAKEATKLISLNNSCGFSISSTQTVTATPLVTQTPVNTPSATPIPTPTPTVSTAPAITPTAAPIATSSSLIVTPGAFCAPSGATGKSTSGVSYTCKTSPTDTRNRWRQ